MAYDVVLRRFVPAGEAITMADLCDMVDLDDDVELDEDLGASEDAEEASEDAAAALQRLAQEWMRVDAERDAAVAAARAAGLSWAVVGSFVGMTRQAAERRWGAT